MFNLRNNGDFIRYHICDIWSLRVFNLLRLFQRSEVPCKHSFSHACLYSYIASHSNSAESRLDFHCPICDVYIPNTRATDNPEEWDVFSGEFCSREICTQLWSEILRSLSAWERRGRRNTPLFYLQRKKKNRTKYHSRWPFTRSHQVSLLSEITYTDLVPDQINVEFCVHHQVIPITLFCQDHE